MIKEGTNDSLGSSSLVINRKNLRGLLVDVRIGACDYEDQESQRMQEHQKVGRWERGGRDAKEPHEERDSDLEYQKNTLKVAGKAFD